MGLGLTILLAFGYGLGVWYSHLPDALSSKAYVPTVAFVGNQTDMTPQPVAAGATGCGSITANLTKESAGLGNRIYQCIRNGVAGEKYDGKISATFSTSDPSLQLIASGSACDVHWYQGGADIRQSGKSFSNITDFSGGGSSLSGQNCMWYVTGQSGIAVACTLQTKVNNISSKCDCVYASTGSVNAPPCTPSNGTGAAPEPAAQGAAPSQQAPSTYVPTYLACGEHTEPDRTCNGSTRTHTVRHEKYCENGQEKLRSVYCDNPAGKWEWVDYTSVVQSDMGKWGGTMGGCESEHPDCSKSVGSNPTQAPAPTSAPRPTTAPQPTVAPPPVVVPPTAVPTAIPAAPTVAPPVPVSNQGVLQIAPLSVDSTYYLSFVTSPGNVAFGLYFANGADISLENQINNALALQGISVPTFKNQTENASLYDLPFLINDPSTRLSFTLYRRPKKDASASFTISTFIEQSKGCLSTAMPNTYVIDITTLQSNTPCR